MDAHPRAPSLNRPLPVHVMLMAPSSAGTELVLDALKFIKHTLAVNPLLVPDMTPLQRLLPTLDVVLIDVTNVSPIVLNVLDDLQNIINISSLRPQVVCFSTAHRHIRFELAIQKHGIRYVRVTNSQTILETIECILAEAEERKRTGPCFRIVHNFWQQETRCAPGEEVGAVFFEHGAGVLQVRLPLTQRLLFDFLASHRRVALDSLQVTSGLAGEWFYREHASNSGHSQFKNIRHATVKVLVQRIRQQLAYTFGEAHFRSNPYDVLRSCRMEGSRGVLYKLRASVRWHHVANGSE